MKPICALLILLCVGIVAVPGVARAQDTEEGAASTGAATSSDSVDWTKVKAVDLNPNPYAKQKTNTNLSIKQAWKKLLQCYGTLNLNAILEAYANFIRVYAGQKEIDRLYAQHEKNYPIELRIGVMDSGDTGITGKVEVPSESLKCVPIPVKITLSNYQINGADEGARDLTTDEQGRLRLLHAPARTHYFRFDGEGYVPCEAQSSLSQSRPETHRLTVLLEQVKAYVYGRVAGLGKPGYGDPQRRNDLYGATVTFTNTSGPGSSVTVTTPAKKPLGPSIWPALPSEVNTYGFFYAKLEPGTYKVEVAQKDYVTLKAEITLEKKYEPVRQDFVLLPVIEGMEIPEAQATEAAAGEETDPAPVSANFDDPLGGGGAE